MFSRCSRALLALVLSAALGTASAGPVAGGQLGLRVDGTSNTVLLTEQTQVTACIKLQNGSTFAITDGTSNTLLFGDGLAFTLRAGTIYSWGSIGSIVDGTSNTVFIGESANGLCLGGETRIVDVGGEIVDGVSNTIQIPEGSRLDLCLRNVSVGSGVSDGTSNTVLFGEVTSAPTCFENVRLTAAEPGPAAVPLPGTLPLLALGAACLWPTRRRFCATRG